LDAKKAPKKAGGGPFLLTSPKTNPRGEKISFPPIRDHTGGVPSHLYSSEKGGKFFFSSLKGDSFFPGVGEGLVAVVCPAEQSQKRVGDEGFRPRTGK